MYHNPPGGGAAAAAGAGAGPGSREVRLKWHAALTEALPFGHSHKIVPGAWVTPGLLSATDHSHLVI